MNYEDHLYLVTKELLIFFSLQIKLNCLSEMSPCSIFPNMVKETPVSLAICFHI